MAGRILGGALVGALILFVFGFLWFGLLQIGEQAFSPVPDSENVSAALASAGIKSGTYIYPLMEHAPGGADGPTTMDEWSALHEKGPLYEIRYHETGMSPMNPGMMITGFVHFVISALIASWLLYMALPVLTTYGRRVMFVTLLGVFAAVYIQPSGPIWFYYPWDRAIYDMIYNVLSWLFAGLGIAAIVKGRTVAD